MMGNWADSMGRWSCYVLAFLVSVLGAVGLVNGVRPLPPTELTLVVPENMVTEAQRYRSQLRNLGIDVRLKRADGNRFDVDAAALQQADAAIALGLNPHAQANGLVSLGAVERLPAWLLFRPDMNENFSHFKRGEVGYLSTDRWSPQLFSLLVQAYGFEKSDFQLRPIAPKDLFKELRKHSFDLFIAVDEPGSEVIQKLVRKDGRVIADIGLVNEWRKLQPKLARLTIARAQLDYYSDIPKSSRSTGALHQHLLVHRDLHPALQRALSDAATVVHGSSGFLRRTGDFPDHSVADLPLSPVLESYKLGVRPYLERIVTYWWAQLLTNLLFAVIPFLILLYVSIMLVDRYFDRRSFKMLETYYGELGYLESKIKGQMTASPMLAAEWVRTLDDVERRIADLEVPKSHRDRWLTLRNHTAMVRQQILQSSGR